jgi:hypothetical protein
VAEFVPFEFDPRACGVRPPAPAPTSETLLAEYVLWPLFVALFCDELVVIGHCCTDNGCNAVAEWRCFWPAQTRAKCTPHRDGWAAVAEVMGFVMVSEPLAVRQWPEPDPSAARFAAMELR